VKQTIECLLAGDKVSDLPTHFCAFVISNVTNMRKDFLAAKMEELLGELKHGPQGYLPDTPEPPATFRSRSLIAVPDTKSTRLIQTAKQLVSGARLDSVDIQSRQRSEPIMKTKRVWQVSRTNYPKSHDRHLRRI
jgi:hypothetical protein